MTFAFLRTPDAIKMFLKPEGPAAVQRLQDRLLDDVIPMLTRFPDTGGTSSTIPFDPARRKRSCGMA